MRFQKPTTNKPKAVETELPYDKQRIYSESLLLLERHMPGWRAARPLTDICDLLFIKNDYPTILEKSNVGSTMPTEIMKQVKRQVVVAIKICPKDEVPQEDSNFWEEIKKYSNFYFRVHDPLTLMKRLQTQTYDK